MRVLAVLFWSSFLMGQILTVPNGGTGQTSLNSHGVLLGNGTSGINSLAPGVGSSGFCLQSTGSVTDPAWQACIPAGSTNGDLAIFNGTTWARFAGNTIANRMLQEDGSGNASWVLHSLGSLTAATSTNSINNASNTQTWQWNLTGSNNGMVIGEGSAGAGTGDIVQINALSQGVMGLDVLAPGTNSGIHFGPTSSTGGWLNAGASGSTITGGVSTSNSIWTARATGAAKLDINPSAGGGFIFYGNTGLTVGNSYTPTVIASLAPNTGWQFPGNAVMTASSSGATAYVGGGVHYTGGTWTADSTQASIIAAQGGGTYSMLFLANTGLTPGNTYAPTVMHSLTWDGHMTVYGGISQGSGMKHQRFSSCTTTAVVNGSCSATVAWTTAFADSSYTVSCLPYAGQPMGITIQTGTTTGAGFSYWLYNAAGSSAGVAAVLECIAMHD